MLTGPVQRARGRDFRKESRHGTALVGRLCDVTASAVPVMTRWATVFRSRARNRASTARLSQQANMAGGEPLARKRSTEQVAVSEHESPGNKPQLCFNLTMPQ